MGLAAFGITEWSAGPVSCISPFHAVLHCGPRFELQWKGALSDSSRKCVKVAPAVRNLPSYSCRSDQPVLWNSSLLRSAEARQLRNYLAELIFFKARNYLESRYALWWWRHIIVVMDREGWRGFDNKAWQYLISSLMRHHEEIFSRKNYLIL